MITNHVMFRCFNEVQNAANQIFTDVTGRDCAVIREDEVIITIPVLTCNNIQTKTLKKAARTQTSRSSKAQTRGDLFTSRLIGCLKRKEVE